MVTKYFLLLWCYGCSSDVNRKSRKGSVHTNRSRSEVPYFLGSHGSPYVYTVYIFTKNDDGPSLQSIDLPNV